MRVIAGEFRSRALQAPKGMSTRPTSDRLRETLFNVLSGGTLGAGVEGARFVDLYAGSGAVGIEAISRGADFVWFAEKAPAAVTAIRANLAALKIAGGFALEDRGVGKLLESMVDKGRVAEFVYLDPPYEAAEEYDFALQFLCRNQTKMLADGAVVIAEHAKKTPTAELIKTKSGDRLERVRLLPQGDAALSFYRRG
ncbi:MAG: 16S rRNA (guanine(966)-N(2))-methyltransferase RsmD [Acidobacteriota bacterium]